MIDIKELKNEAIKFPEPLKSIIEIARNTMSPDDFIDFFIGLRQKAREIDIKNKEMNKWQNQILVGLLTPQIW